MVSLRDKPFIIFLCLAEMVLLSATWTQAIQVADSGEMVAAACGLGVAHPPGYPLYVFLGHALCQFPFSTGAGRVGLLSAASAVAAVLLLFGIVRRLGVGPWAALGAALTLATGSLFWRYGSLAEVFALHIALSLGVVYGAIRADLSRDLGRQCLSWTAASAALLGLAMANHHTAALTGITLAVVVFNPRGGILSVGKRFAVALGAFLLGLVPYAQLYLSPRHALPRWGETHSVTGFIHHVLRMDYGTLKLAVGQDASPLSALGAFFSALPGQLGWALGVLTFVGAGFLWARDSKLSPSSSDGVGLGMRRALVALPILAGPAFLMLFNIEAEGEGRQVVERFFILPSALLCIPLGYGLGWLETRGASAAANRRLLLRLAVGSLLFLTALRSYPEADVSENYAVEDYAQNALKSVTPGALLLGTGDARTFSIWHAQGVLGIRRDVHYVDVRLLSYRWYVRQQKRRDPTFPYEFKPRNVDTLRLIHRALRQGRVVYIANGYSGRVRKAFRVYPIGPVFRVVGLQQVPPPLGQVIADNRRVFKTFSRRGRDPDPLVDRWSAALRETFATPWESIARDLARRSLISPAFSALAEARTWAPWKANPPWAQRWAKGPKAKP